jgi:RNA polymerase sigma factor (sigma-70 family)
MSRLGRMAIRRPPQSASSAEPGKPTLAALCAAVAGGDERAFQDLHRRLAGGLMRILLERTGGRAEVAEELAQRTWVVVWEAIRGGKYDPSRSAITTYLYAVSHKVWLQYVRSTARGPISSGETDSGATAGEEPVSVAGMAELLQAVRECMEGAGADALTPDERALARAVASGHSDRSLAKMLGLAPSTTNVRKRAVFEKIRRFLAVRGHRGSASERDGANGE